MHGRFAPLGTLQFAGLRLNIRRIRFASGISNLLPVLILLSTVPPCTAATDVPRLKPGLWEMTVEVNGAKSPLPSSVCVGAMTDQQRQLYESNIKLRCDKYESRNVGGKWVIDGECAAGGNSIRKHTVMSLNGDAFREENTSPKGSMVSEGKWLSQCKPGQAPSTFK